MSYGLKQTSSTTNTFDLNRLEMIGLTLAANGLADAEIASRLSVSEADVDAALAGAVQKLGARNRLQAVAIAIRKGLIGIEV
ncbi:LuxR C-terminal-related transcriptional regulator [Rhizobium sp.]